MNEQLQQWAIDVLQALGDFVTRDSVVGLYAWGLAEGGWFGNNARYNPLNTTERMPGSSTINSAQVQSYQSYNEGIQAVTITLRNGLYGNILSVLQNNEGPQALATAVENSPWGTGQGVFATIGTAETEVNYTEEEMTGQDWNTLQNMLTQLKTDLTHLNEDLYNNQYHPLFVDIQNRLQAIEAKIGA